jgi:hypothetical protein
MRVKNDKVSTLHLESTVIASKILPPEFFYLSYKDRGGEGAQVL